MASKKIDGTVQAAGLNISKTGSMETDLSWLVLSKIYLFNIQRVSIGVLLNFGNLANSDVQHVDCGLITSLLGCFRGCLALLLLFFLAGCILQIDSTLAVESTAVHGWG